MKIHEAKSIVNKMMVWTMISEGILYKNPEPIKEDLKTLIMANEMVKRYNIRRRDNIIENNITQKRRRNICMPLPDKDIAALYVAIKFNGSPPNSADMISSYGDSLVFCLSKKMISNNEI